MACSKWNKFDKVLLSRQNAIMPNKTRFGWWLCNDVACLNWTITGTGKVVFKLFSTLTILISKKWLWSTANKVMSKTEMSIPIDY